MIEPISFNEVEEKFFETQIPEKVINVVNNLILEHYKPNSKESVVKQDEILNEICTEETGYSHNYVFDHHWLDFEKLYAKYGWSVEYNRASYGEEDFDPYFVFKEKKK